MPLAYIAFDPVLAGEALEDSNVMNVLVVTESSVTEASVNVSHWYSGQNTQAASYSLSLYLPSLGGFFCS